MLVIVPCWDGAVKTEVRRSGSGADGGQLGEVVAQGGLEAQQVVNELSRLSEVGRLIQIVDVERLPAIFVTHEPYEVDFGILLGEC